MTFRARCHRFRRSNEDAHEHGPDRHSAHSSRLRLPAWLAAQGQAWLRSISPRRGWSCTPRACACSPGRPPSSRPSPIWRASRSRWPRAGRPIGACRATPACRRSSTGRARPTWLAVKVRYPAPSRMHEPGAETIGYKMRCHLPGRGGAEGRRQARRPRAHRGVRRLPRDLHPGRGEVVADAASRRSSRARRSRHWSLRSSGCRARRRAAAPSDPQVERVTASPRRRRPRLSIEARFPQGGRGADVFVEAPDGLYVPLPKRLLRRPSATRCASRSTCRAAAMRAS